MTSSSVAPSLRIRDPLAGLPAPERRGTAPLAYDLLPPHGTVVITGAGVSTDSGIPDYRSPGGSAAHPDDGAGLSRVRRQSSALLGAGLRRMGTLSRVPPQPDAPRSGGRSSGGDDHAEAGALLLEALAERDERASKLAEQAVVVVTQADPKAQGSDVARVASGYRELARDAITIPFDPAMVDGVLRYGSLRPATQRAWLAAGAAVARGL